jgi:membrane protein implicated in regulation of membrane protease activity
MEVWIYWLIGFIVLVILELMTQWISAFCFAVGCAVALVASFFGLSLSVQLIVLAIGALLAFVLFGKKLVSLNMSRCDNSARSNVDALYGRKVRVTERIPSDGLGRVKVDGDNWQARSKDNEAIEAGEMVEIVDNDSIVMIVVKCNDLD